MPNEDCLIPSGIKCEVPSGFALIAFNKSGIATKKKLQVGACVVDEDYIGEIHLHVYNWGKEPIVLNANDKLTQFILMRYGRPTIEVVDEKDMFVSKKTERGTGGFGSTNKPKTQPQPKTEPVKENVASVKMIERIPGKVAHLVKIDSVKESQKGGTYQRHYFRDADNWQLHYILDVSKISAGVFKHLQIGDTLMGLQTFTMNNKDYINGKSKAVYIGKWSQIEEQVVKKQGFTI